MLHDAQLSLFNDEPNAPRTTVKEWNPAAPRDPAGRRVFVVDAYGLVYQVFHALPEMQGRKGESVNAVFGFLRDVLFLLEHLSPDFLFCAFDVHAPTFRHEAYDQYKIQREKMPEDLRSQIPRIKQVLEDMRIPILQVPGFEADDILATVAAQTQEAGGECFLVTSDKDCRQLLADHVQIYSLRRGKYLDEAFLMDDWGITPAQVVDYQSLVGDSSDNIPGIAKIGPKIARELLQRFGCMEEILKPENITAYFGAKPSVRKQNLLDGKEILCMSRKLVTLRRDVPITVDWHLGHVSQFDFLAARPTFQDYAFNSLTPKLLKLNEQYAPEAAEIAHQPHTASYSQNMPAEDTLDTDFVAPDIPVFPGRFYPQAVKNDEKHDTDILFLLPAEYEKPQSEAFRETLALHRAKLEDPGVVKVGFDLKKVWKTLHEQGVKLAGPLFDTMIAAYLLIPGEKDITLRELTEQFPDAVPPDFVPPPVAETEDDGPTVPETLFDDLHDENAEAPEPASPKKAAKNSRKTQPHFSQYAGFQRTFLENLLPVLAQCLAQARLDVVCYAVEFPLIPLLAEMEYAGIYVDQSRLAILRERFAEKETTLREELMQLAYPDEDKTTLEKQTLNLNSPIQLQKLLFEKFGLPVIRKTKTGISTDAQTLEELAAMNLHPFPAKLLEYRQISKLMNTYVEALPAMIDPKTQRIHTTFNQAVTATGRLSSSEPNLQNIPIRTNEGREIRSAFMPQSGWKFLSADYSQIELRVLAHYCKDENLCDAFHRDEDIHTQVASQIFATAPQHVTSAMRRVAKSVNFGVIYGQSAFGLSKQLAITQDEAQHFITTYFARFPSIQQFLDHVLDEALAKGYVSTILGRHRRISGIRTMRKGQLNLAERMAVNAVIQGSAADIIKLAMLAVHKQLRQKKYESRLLLQIHDELLLECPANETDAVQTMVETEMTGVWHLDVPLKVSAVQEDDWGAKE